MSVEDIIYSLDGVKQIGRNTWQAKCPCHDDKKASLSITLEYNETILLKCHAGCSTENIVEALGIKMKDLFSAGTSKAQKPPQQPRSSVIKVYQYHDKNGGLLCEKLRRADKSFSWRRKDSNGGYIYNRQGVPHVLYRSHEVAKSDVVIVCEGEKDADTVANTGLTATTGENGAGHGKWLPGYTQQLAGKHVIVLGDNDAVGRAYQVETANALHGKVKSVKVLDITKIWEYAPEHGDITGYFEAVGQDEALDVLVMLMHDTPEWTPATPLVQEKTAVKPTEADRVFNVRPNDFSDSGNADVFSKAYIDSLIYTKALGWLWWSGTVWERDEFIPIQLAKELTEEMLAEASNRLKQAQLAEMDAMAADDDTALAEAKKAVRTEKAYQKHAKASRNAVRIKAMIELSVPSFVVKAEQFDANPFDLNTPSGIVNLLTGETKPHDRTAYCSQITLSAPSNNGAVLWDDFLNAVTCNSEPIKGYLQQVAGMAAVGAVYQEGIILAHGGGRNGKSTFFNALGHVFGSYSGGIDVKVLTTDRQNKGASLATLRGKRLVVTGELEEHQRLSVATIKQLASTDKITIEEKFKSPEEVTPMHSLVLFTNHLPRVGSTDAGTWRRLTVVPFNATIPQGTGVQNYANVLAEKAGGSILSWAIQGAVKFMKNGFKLNVPDEIQAATDAYRSREDWLTNFIDERCVRDVNARVGANELYKVYRSWAEETGDYIRRLNEFTDAMEAAKFQKITPKNRKMWVGLKTNYSDLHCGIPASGY